MPCGPTPSAGEARAGLAAQREGRVALDPAALAVLELDPHPLGEDVHALDLEPRLEARDRGGVCARLGAHARPVLGDDEQRVAPGSLRRGDPRRKAEQDEAGGGPREPPGQRASSSAAPW